MLHTAHSLRLPQPVHIVGVARNRAAGRSGYCGQTPAVDPGEVVPVVPVRGIAYLVIRDRLSTVRRQQILPVAVAVGVGVGVCPIADRTDVAVGVVSVGIGDAVHRLRQHLPVTVVGVACRSGAADGRDVAYVVINLTPAGICSLTFGISMSLASKMKAIRNPHTTRPINAFNAANTISIVLFSPSVWPFRSFTAV